jgi:hypothetical protein
MSKRREQDERALDGAMVMLHFYTRTTFLTIGKDAALDTLRWASLVPPGDPATPSRLATFVLDLGKEWCLRSSTLLLLNQPTDSVLLMVKKRDALELSGHVDLGYICKLVASLLLEHNVQLFLELRLIKLIGLIHGWKLLVMEL